MIDPALEIRGNTIHCSELVEDVEAAKRKGLLGKFAFTTETVDALLERFYTLMKDVPPFEYEMDRVRIAAAYWLEASDHEKTEEDGIILAKFTQYILQYHMHNIDFLTGNDFADASRKINQGLTNIISDMAALEAELVSIKNNPNRQQDIDNLQTQLEQCQKLLENYKVY